MTMYRGVQGRQSGARFLIVRLRYGAGSRNVAKK